MKLPTINCSYLLLLTLLVSSAFAAADTAPDKKPEGVALGSSGFNDLLAKQIQPGVLTTEALKDGSYKLNNPIQTLQAHVTANGTTFISTSKEKNKQGEFSLSLVQWGRENNLQTSASSKIYRDGDNVFHTHTDGIAEKFSNTGNGIQQDFIIPVKPDGDGALQIQLSIDGATLQNKNDGFTVALNNSQRVLTYDRLKVTDAEGKNISAHMQLTSNNQINIVVDDRVAQYPLTIDPTVGDENWVSMGGISGTDAQVLSIAAHGNSIYIAGSFKVFGNTLANNIIKWDGSSWALLGSGVGCVISGCQTNQTWIGALAIDTNGNLFAGGEFTYAGGVPVNNIAKWDGSSWSPLGSGMAHGYIFSLVIDNNGYLYAGGYFSSAGGVSVNNIAKWDGSVWSAIGSGLTGGTYCSSSSLWLDDACVATLSVDSANNIYAGGSFTMAGGIPASNIAKWDGSNWSQLGGGISGTVNVIRFDNSGSLYAGGMFSTAGGVSVNNITRWDGSNWSALGSGVNSRTRSLTFDGAGNLYAGGDFTSAGGLAVHLLAKWNGSTWVSIDSSSSRANGVLALCFDNTGNLYAGGQYQLLGSLVTNNIAKWDGNIWSAIGSTGNPNTYPIVIVSRQNIWDTWAHKLSETFAS